MAINLFSRTSQDNKLSLIEEKERRTIVGKVDQSDYGIFSPCYSQPKNFVMQLCDQIAKKNYDTEKRSHELGQCTVDIVLSALNALPNVKAWQTPTNSVADVHWKWDLIIEHEDYFYPVQVKSGLDAIKDCKGLFQENLCNKIDVIHEKKDDIEQQHESRIERFMHKYGLTSRKNASIVAITKEKEQKLEQLKLTCENYEKASPLYIWAARDEDTIKALTRIFTQLFSPGCNSTELEDKAVKIHKNNYKTIKEILIEEETEKVDKFKKIITYLQEYLNTKQSIKHNQTNQSIEKKVYLEDILILKIIETALILAATGLKYSEFCLKEILNHKSYKIDVPPESKYHLSRVKATIKEEIERKIPRERLHPSNREIRATTRRGKRLFESEFETKLEKIMKSRKEVKNMAPDDGTIIPQNTSQTLATLDSIGKANEVAIKLGIGDESC